MNERGKAYEDRACAYLSGLGYQILARNVHSRYGEIDIVARDGNYTVFVEVKYRESASHGFPVETITRAKRDKLVKTALCYLEQHGEDYYRFDAVVMLGERLEHLRNIDLSD